MSGIAEFMAPSFLRLWHPLMNGAEHGETPSSTTSESKVADGTGNGSSTSPGPAPTYGGRLPSDSREVYCASLTEILHDTLGMSHINFWVLDVEVSPRHQA